MITARYRITQELIDDYCEEQELNSCTLYTNDSNTLYSYTLNGDTHVYEEPEYKTEIQEVEFDEMQKEDGIYYVPSFKNAMPYKFFSDDTTISANTEINDYAIAYALYTQKVN